MVPVSCWRLCLDIALGMKFFTRFVFRSGTTHRGWKKMPSQLYLSACGRTHLWNAITFEQLFNSLHQQLPATRGCGKQRRSCHVRNHRRGDLRLRLLELESSQVTGVNPLAVAKCRGIFNGRKCWGACLSHLIWWRESGELVYSPQHWASVPPVSQRIFLRRQMSAASGKLRNASFN